MSFIRPKISTLIRTFCGFFKQKITCKVLKKLFSQNSKENPILKRNHQTQSGDQQKPDDHQVKRKFAEFFNIHLFLPS